MTGCAKSGLSKQWVTSSLKNFPRTPFLVSNNTVAKYLGIEDDNVKGLHKIAILGRYTSSKAGRGFEILRGVGRWEKELASGQKTSPPINFFSFGHAETKYNTAANMKMLLDLVDGMFSQLYFPHYTLYFFYESI